MAIYCKTEAAYWQQKADDCRHRTLRSRFKTKIFRGNPVFWKTKAASLQVITDHFQNNVTKYLKKADYWDAKAKEIKKEYA